MHDAYKLVHLQSFSRISSVLGAKPNRIAQHICCMQHTPLGICCMCLWDYYHTDGTRGVLLRVNTHDSGECTYSLILMRIVLRARKVVSIVYQLEWSRQYQPNHKDQDPQYLPTMWTKAGIGKLLLQHTMWPMRRVSKHSIQISV